MSKYTSVSPQNGHDVLAAAAGLERGRRLAAAARGPAGRVERGLPAGPVPLPGRLLPRQSAQWGIHTGPSPVYRGGAGSKHHLITDGNGTPLAVLLTAVQVGPGVLSRRGRCRRGTLLLSAAVLGRQPRL